MNIHPPKWADRFLKWYCTPELLEEIQGDAHELYYERLEQEGKKRADWKYAFDIIRFCRWSNVKTPNEMHKPNYLDILWRLNFKIVLRNAAQNKFIFSVKMLSLSICLAFALLLSAFVLQEYSYDQHIKDHQRIYRVGVKIDIGGSVTNYGASPELLAEALEEEVPEIEIAAFYDDEMFNYRNIFEVNELSYSNEKALATSANLANMLDIKFIQGSNEVLDELYSIVLTESTAKKFFGTEDPMGKTIDFNGIVLDVAGIIEDPISSSHLKYDILLSWEGYDFYCSCWDGVEVYTYIKLNEAADINEVEAKISQVLAKNKMDIVGTRFQSGEEMAVVPIIENIKDIHLSNQLLFDTAEKRDITNLNLLMVAAIFFFLTGFINFLNLSLAELTTNYKKIGVLQVFGGSMASPTKAVLANTLLSLFVISPLTVVLFVIGLQYAQTSMGISIENNVLLSQPFVLILGGFALLFIFSSRISSFVVAQSGDLLSALKGKLSVKHSGFRLRELIVGTQLSFSIIMIALIFIIVDQFQFINAVDKGFEDKNTLVIKVPDGNYSETKVWLESLQQLTGVKKTGISSFYTDEFEWTEVFEIETENGTRKEIVNHEYWGYGFTDLLNMEITMGRDFDPNVSTDKHGAYLINETAAAKFGWNDPVGKSIVGPGAGYGRHERKVIGVVKDFNFASLHKKIEPLIIFMGTNAWTTEYAYLKLDPIRSTTLIPQIEEAYHEFYENMPFDWEFLDEKFASLYKQDYQVRDIFQIGLFISILVSCLGVFSVSALLVFLRAKEMGIRKIVGADQIHLFGLHIRNFVKFIVIAVLIAWPIIYYLSSYWLDNFAYRIDLSIGYFIFPGLITLLIILVTSGFHGIKSSRINPIDILNQE